MMHFSWRAFSNDRRTDEAFGVVDGDLLKKFLALNDTMQEQAVTLMNDSMQGSEPLSVKQVAEMLEDMHELTKC